MSETIRLYFANLAAYNSGVLDGKWYDLEDYFSVESLMHDVKVEVLHQNLDAEGNPFFACGVSEEEYAIHDYEAPFKVSEYTGLAEIAAMLAWSNLEEYDQRRSAYLYDNGNYQALQDAIDNADECDFYPDRSLIDIAYERVEDGYYGNIPECLKYHIDYDSIARELQDNGWEELSTGCYCVCIN